MFEGTGEDGKSGGGTQRQERDGGRRDENRDEGRKTRRRGGLRE